MPCAGWLIIAVLVFGSELRWEKNICAVSEIFVKYFWVSAYFWNICKIGNWHRKHHHINYWNWRPVRYFSRLSIKPRMQLTSLWCTLHPGPCTVSGCSMHPSTRVRPAQHSIYVHSVHFTLDHCVRSLARERCTTHSLQTGCEILLEIIQAACSRTEWAPLCFGIRGGSFPLLSPPDNVLFPPLLSMAA